MTQWTDFGEKTIHAGTDTRSGAEFGVTSVDSEKSPPLSEEVDGEASSWEFTAPAIIQATRDSIIRAIGSRHDKKLIRRSRALYWDASHAFRVACTISKRYTKKGVSLSTDGDAAGRSYYGIHALAASISLPLTARMSDQPNV